MKIRYINLDCCYSGYDEKDDDKSDYNSRFVSNWLSKEVRRHNLETDGSFRMISVHLKKEASEIRNRIISEYVLDIGLLHTEEEHERYLGMKDERERFEFYLDRLTEGIKVAATIKEFDCETLLGLIQQFREQGYKNEWLQKRVTLKELGLKVEFISNHNSYDYHLDVNVIDKKKNVVARKTVFTTYPDEIFYQKRVTKKVVIKDNLIYILDFLDHPFLSINIDLLKDGIIEEKIYEEHILEYTPEADPEGFKRIRWE
jgi:hypothetical protein